jgi:hypothetical protein
MKTRKSLLSNFGRTITRKMAKKYEKRVRKNKKE